MTRKHITLNHILPFLTAIFTLGCLNLRAQNQSVSWLNGGATNNYKSNQRICRSNEGFLECNTPLGYYIGISSKASPAGLGHMDYGVRFNSSVTPNRIDLYANNAVAASYNTPAPLTATGKIRFERKGSTIIVYYEAVAGQGLNPILYCNSDANFYYRLHAITTAGGSTASLNAVVSVSWINPCSGTNTPGADAGLNWAQSKMFDNGQEEAAQVGESRTFMNRFGSTIQTQSKDFSVTTNSVIGVETVYDAQGRPVLQSLPAPTGSSNVQYRSKFIQATDGTTYDYVDFDMPVTSSNTLGEVNNPKPVGTQSNSIGNYYSTSNTSDGYVPVSSYPYSRVEYAPDGSVRKVSGAGEMHKMGTGREMKTYTINAGQELNYFYGGRKSFEVNPDPYDPLNNMPPRDIAQNINATKTITINPDGVRSIQYHSASGLLLAQCISGRPESYPCANLTVRHKLYANSRAQYLDEFGTGSVNIHLPATTSSSLQIMYDPGYCVEYTVSSSNYCNGSSGYTGGPAQHIALKIFDLAADKFLTLGTDYNLTVNMTNNKMTVAFINGYANKEGYYRISYNYTCEYYKLYDYYYIRGYEPPIMVVYQLDYSNWTINYYDQKGQLRRTVSPQGIDCTIGDPTQQKIEKFSYSKDFYNTTSYLSSFDAVSLTVDNSSTSYGPDLNFRVRGLVKSGVVTGPSGGGNATDGIFNAYYEFVDRKTAPSPTNPKGGGEYETYTPSTFATIYNPPTDVQTEAVSYSFPAMAPGQYNNPNDGGYPSTCFNGVLDPGEMFIDFGGPCGFSYGNDYCTDPPQLLASYKIKLEFKKGTQVLATQYIYRTLGVTCDDKLIEMDNPPGVSPDPLVLSPEVEQTITNAQLGSGSSINIVVRVADVKVLNTTNGQYDITFNPTNVAAHRFIRYILLKVDLEKETYFKNTNAHSLKTSYHYNDLGWLLAVNDPDRGKTEFIYDDEGKLRFSQDARQRATSISCFSFIRYDAQGRVAETGQYHDQSTSPYYFPNSYYELDVISSINQNDTKCLLNATTRNSTALIFSGLGRSDIVNYYYDIPLVPAPPTVPAGYSTFFGEGRVVRIDNDEGSINYRYNYRGETTGSVHKFSTLGANDIGYKTFDYEYDFFGRLKKTTFQLNTASEKFSHVYTYSGNGDLKFVETINQTETAKRHLFNHYYKTGALKRTVLGQATQGLDYVYTIDGKLKSINHPLLDSKDPGGDGYSGFAGPWITPKDVFALALDYYPNDYVRTGTNISYGIDNSTNEKYDSRIKSVRWNTRHAGVQAPANKETMYKYDYDWEQNLVLATFGDYTPNATTNNASGGGGYGSPVYGSFTPKANNGYTEQMKDAGTEPSNWYDRNGNLQYLKRYKSDGTIIDNLDYEYAPTNANRLRHVIESATFTDPQINHVLPQVTDNYLYNENGDIKEDLERNVKLIYTSYGLLTEVRNRTNNNMILRFTYDPAGKRIRKIACDANGNAEKITLYMRDASGALFCIYEDHVTATPGQFVRTEIMLDGGAMGTYFTQQNKYVYRLADHLGNTRVTIDRENNSTDPVILSYADYYAWGMTMPGREYSTTPKFRLAYQGQEYESKVGMYGFSLRMYDQRLGRWFSNDPYRQHWSPYLAMSNNPVSFVDPDGGEDWWDRNGVNYYVDGMQVESWDFRNYILGPGIGDRLDFSGSLFSGMRGLTGITFNKDRGWGFWIDNTLLQNRPDLTSVITEIWSMYWDDIAHDATTKEIFTKSNKFIATPIAGSIKSLANKISSKYDKFVAGPQGYNPKSSQPVIFAWMGDFVGKNFTEEVRYEVAKSLVDANPISGVYIAVTGHKMYVEDLNDTERAEASRLGGAFQAVTSLIPAGKGTGFISKSISAHKNSNGALGNYWIYAIKVGQKLWKVGKADSDRQRANGDPERIAQQLHQLEKYFGDVSYEILQEVKGVSTKYAKGLEKIFIQSTNSPQLSTDREKLKSMYGNGN